MTKAVKPMPGVRSSAFRKVGRGERRMTTKRKGIAPRITRDMTDHLREVLDSWDDWEERLRKREPEFLRYLEAEMVGRVRPRKGILGRERKERAREARRIINKVCWDMAIGKDPFGEYKRL